MSEAREIMEAAREAHEASPLQVEGDEFSVLNAYTSAHLGTQQPGLTAEQRGETASEDDWMLTANEDDPRWYETDEDDSYDYSTPEPAQEPFVIDGIEFQSREAAEQWAEARQMNQLHQDPIASSVLSIIDSRINAKAGEIEAAQQWAQEGQTERAQRAEIAAIQQEMNDQQQGEAALNELAQAAANYHGLPPSNSEAVHDLSNQYFEQSTLAFLNNGGTPEQWNDVQAEVAQRCVEQAAVDLGRAQISHNALKRI